MKCKGKRQLFSDYKYKARKRGFKFHLTYELFCEILLTQCHYCGKHPGNRTISTGANKYVIKAGGVDRKSSKRGYTLKNVLPCCGVCNRMKSDMGYTEFLKKVRSINLCRWWKEIL